jgi:hypothetical protein
LPLILVKRGLSRPKHYPPVLSFSGKTANHSNIRHLQFLHSRYSHAKPSFFDSKRASLAFAVVSYSIAFLTILEKNQRTSDNFS